MRRFRQVCLRFFGAISAAAAVMTMSPVAIAQTPAAPRPVAKVSIEQAQLAFIGSAAVGKGKLYFQGRVYPFTINGLGVGGIGASKITARGDVYELARVSDLEGIYGQVRLGWAIANHGDGRLWLQNERGVVMRLQTKRQGLMLAAGADAVRIQLP